MHYIKLGNVIQNARSERCGDREYPVLSITKSDGIVLQRDKFKKRIASQDTDQYKIVYRGQLVQGIHIDEANFGIQDVVDSGIVSPAYKIWNVNEALIIPKYLAEILRSPRSIQYYSSRFNGSVKRRERLSDKDFLAMEIPCPSIDEQEHVLKVIRKVRDIIADRWQEISKLDELIKARFVEMFGNPIKNTRSLKLKRLEELGTWNSGGTPSRTKPEYYTGNINWYSAGELNSLYLHGSIEKITDAAIEESAAKLFKAGSMLVGMYDTAAFKMGILVEDSASNQACACIEPNESVNIVWLYYALLLMKEHYLSQRRGVRQKNLNLGMIKGFELPVAEKADQDGFVAFVRQVDKSKVV